MLEMGGCSCVLCGATVVSTVVGLHVLPVYAWVPSLQLYDCKCQTCDEGATCPGCTLVSAGGKEDD